MRVSLFCFCCLGLFYVPAFASLLRESRQKRDVVAKRRLTLRRMAGKEQKAHANDTYAMSTPPPEVFLEIKRDDPSFDSLGLGDMELSPVAKPASEVPKPLAAYTPESMANVADFAVAMATPMPAAFNGEYCKGGACQFRTAPPPPLPPTPIPITPPPMPIGGNIESGREFCRGLTCIQGMGMPGDPKLQAYNLNCVRLYNDIAGGMVGQDLSRTVPEAYQSFINVCHKRVGPLEVGACPAYANTIVGAVSPKVNGATVGGPIEVCTDTYWFTVAYKTAEIDLKLTKAALPKGNSLLAVDLNRLGTGGVGPSSPRGLKWREWVYKNGRWPSPPTVSEELAGDGGFKSAFVQTGADPDKKDKKKKPPIPGADKLEDTPRGLPKYTQNVPCAIKEVHNVPQSHTKYQIAPGSPDGTVPPTEIDGDLFTYCANQFSEIMMGFGQTAIEVVKLTKAWCTWQASVSSWVGQQDEFGHPDWNHRTCSNMENFMAFNLKDQLPDRHTGLSAQQVCKTVFLTIGAVHRTDSIVHEAWAMQSTRAAPEGGFANPSAGDDGMKELMKQAQEMSQKVFSALRGQKEAYEKLNGAKMDTSAFDSNSVENPPPPPAPDLPDSDDLDPTLLLSLSVARVRESTRVGLGQPLELKPWGHTESSTAGNA